MPRTADPAVRRALVERAAHLLARREPVTLRVLVQGTGASTMAVYTHFGGMPGLWRAVRQEGHTRLAAALDAVPRTGDAVRDLAALGAAYVGAALAAPDLYAAMFDPRADLEDPAAAERGYRRLVSAVEAVRATGRLPAAAAPEEVAARLWSCGHGVASLGAAGLLPRAAVAAQGPDLALGVLLAAGAAADDAGPSVRAGWVLPG
ncbi:TetR/AcrR family transcriptional regulator [Vallicoccus soli]|uniref:TetR/AcrR family transcriptional regulator n=1 Tax=Vallicoccus soli TaxID=2339232 RepID=UPI0015AB96B4|nr:WHG domain-containing protein [Vallicoccus soli]